MSTYTFIASSKTQLVDWSTPAIWSGGVVPNDSSADVVFPEVDYASNNSPFISDITVTNSYAIASLSIKDNVLNIYNHATLTISGALNVATGGEVDLGAGVGGSGNLTVGSCDNDGLDVAGQGTLNCAGLFLNQSVLAGSGLSATAARFENAGSLEAGPGGLTLTVAPGGFSNLSNSTLIGGNYIANGGVLSLNIGGVITTDAGYISLQGGDIQSYDSAQSAYKPIEKTLQTIAPTGALMLADGADSWSAPLQVGGLLLLEQSDLSTPQLTIGKGAQLMGLGEVSGPLVNDGTIVVGLRQAVDPDFSSYGGTLELSGPVTGTGTAVITQGREESLGSSVSYAPWTLQLDGAASLNVQFLATDGLLVLKDPSGYTGTITPDGAGDHIELPGVGLSSVTGYSYAGDSAGGTLTIDVAGSKIALKFAGDLDTQDFSLAAGPQILSTDPPSLMITVGDTTTATAASAPVDVRGHFVGSFTQILISDTNGDVVVGQINSGPIDNFQETYQRIAGLGPEWTFRGDGDFMGDGHSDFLIQNTNGALAVGEYDNGTVKYTALPVGLGPDWTFHGSGDFLGLGHDQILVEETSGAIDLCDPQGGAHALTRIGGLGSEWKVVGTGDYLGGSLSQFLIENTSGVVVMSEVEKGAASYIQIGALGSEWKFVGDGDVLGDGKDQFLIQNSAGEVVAGEIGAGDKVQYVALGALGPDWTFEGSGDYLSEGHDQFVVENKNGAVVIGDYVGNQLHYTQVGALGSAWTFHD